MAKPSQARHPSLERAAAVPRDGLALRELLAILRRRRRVIFSVTAVVTTVAVLIGLQVTQNLYRDRAGDDRAAGEPDHRRREGRAGAAGRGQRDHRHPYPADPVAREPGARGRQPRPGFRSALRTEPDGAPEPRGGAAGAARRLAARLAERSAAGALGARGRHRDRRRAGAHSRGAARAGDRYAPGRRAGDAVGAILRPGDQLHRRRPGRGGPDRQRHRRGVHRRAARREALRHPPRQRLARRAGRAAPLARVRLRACDRGVPRRQGSGGHRPARVSIPSSSR